MQGTDLGIVLGVLGVVFTLASFAVKSMLYLRALALVGNACFVAYGLVESQLPSLALNCILIPLNVARLWEIRKLSREIAHATEQSPVTQWLLPHMRRHLLKAGEVLFRKGDPVDRLIYLASGELKMAEIGETMGPGALIGEVGLFSPEKKRTLTVVCVTDCEIYDMTDEMMFQLYFQNPKLGFYFMRLVAGRLISDVRRLEGKPAAG